MNDPQVPVPAATSSIETATEPAARKAKPRKGGRVSAADGGGTSGQAERRRELREFFAEQFYKAQRNPNLRFKPAYELAADYEVDEKTIRDDVKYLRDREGLPIKPIRARGGYGFTEEVKAFAGDEFTRGEYLALWLSVQSFEAWGGLPHQKKMPGIMRKLKSTAAALNPEQLKRMQQTITFKAGGFQAPVDQGIFETVLRALLEREELQFEYASLTQRRDAVEQRLDAPVPVPNVQRLTSKGICDKRVSEAVGATKTLPAEDEGRGCSGTANQAGRFVALRLPKGAVIFARSETRRVQPLHLLCWEHAWYLFAWDHARQDIRTFALGRMSDVQATGTRFTPTVKFNVRNELAKSFGITRGGKAVQVRLRFRKRVLPLVIERIWHPSQEMIENADGTLELTMQVAVTPELVRWVQSWGSDVTALGPESLDDRLLDECRKTLEEAAKRRGLRWVIEE